jgi:hypothetical protein
VCAVSIVGFREILRHWVNYHTPEIQKQIVRILVTDPTRTSPVKCILPLVLLSDCLSLPQLMVPIYAICSFATLLACAGNEIPARCSGDAPRPATDSSGSVGGTLDRDEVQQRWLLSGAHGQPAEGHASHHDGGSCTMVGTDSCYEGAIGYFNLFLSLLREGYEAYTLYSFFIFLTLQVPSHCARSCAHKLAESVAIYTQLCVVEMRSLFRAR